MKQQKPNRLFSRAAAMLLMMMLTAATAWADSAFGGGDGSQANPYLITSTSDLDQLATDVNSDTDYENVYFKQTADITYSTEGVGDTESNYTTIGGYYNNQYRYFKGHYDGQGHTISGIRIYKGGITDSDERQGLFGYIGGSADIQCITLANARITGNSFTGGIVGNNDGTVSDCHVASDVIIDAAVPCSYHGGIVGYNCGTVSNCTSAATLTKSDACGDYGGIAGYNNGTLRNNVAIGAVVPTAADNTHGAICGENTKTLQNNYYYGCTVAGVENATGKGCNNVDVTGNDGAVNSSPNHCVQNGNEYTIKSAGGWNVFCGLLITKAKNYFTGKTIKLNDNITVSRMAGASYHDFTGTFDGNNKTLTFNYTTSAENAAPFQYVENATIQNLRVAGTIQTSNKFAAGFIAQQYETVSIQNCRSSVVIKSSIGGDGTHGGFVAVNNNSASLTIDGCVFDGKLLTTGTTATTKCGGFVGYSKNSVTVTNSLYTPAALENGEMESTSESATFVRNGSAGDNCYYTRILGTAQGGGLPTFTTRGDGDGTSANPYKITSADDLKDLAIYVNGTGTYSNGLPAGDAHDCADVYFEQTNPIMLTGAWTPIGTNGTHPFKGHYDGGEYTISGLQVTGNYLYAGLFGYISSTEKYPGTYNSTELKDIRIVDCNINVVSVSGSYAGGIAGMTGPVNISGCRISGNIAGYFSACGLIGYAGSSYGVMVNNCFVDVAVSGTGYDYSQLRLMLTIGGGTPTGSGNYYHDRGNGTAVGYESYINATPLYTVSGAPSGLTVAATNATLTHGGTRYFAANATVTLTVDDANKVITAFTATGASGSSMATDKHSATVTLGSNDVTVTATLQTVSGTCGDNLTWSLAKDGSGNYTLLTISGSGTMWNYNAIDTSSPWYTDAPWGNGVTSVTIGNSVTGIGRYAFIGCQSLATVTIGSSVTDIGQKAFDHCDALTTVTLPASVTSLHQGAFNNCSGLQRIDIGHDGAVSLAGQVFQNCGALQYIVFPSIAAEQANTTGNWSGLAEKRRAKFGNQHFGVTKDKTNTAVYAIATAADLRNLAAAVNAKNSGSGKTFLQTVPIDLANGGNFTPIGFWNSSSDSQYFYGTYDGGDNTVSGLNVNGNYYYAGLFGAVDAGGTVKNVRLVSPKVTSSRSGARVAALIGSASGCTIENCLVISPDVSATTSSTDNRVGALVGHLSNTTVQNCFVISPTVSAEGSNRKGAICGYAYSAGSYNYCTLTNVYYYDSSLDAIGQHDNSQNSKGTISAAHLVTPGDNVTILTPMANDLGFSYNSTDYWREGAELTLSELPDAPEGYLSYFYTATAGTINGTTYIVGTADATVSLNLQAIPWDGKGTQNEPWVISYPSQLLLLAYRVNGTHGETANEFSGSYFKLGANITFSYDPDEGNEYEENYEAIGGYYAGYKYFKGNFDGDDYTVSGIRIRKTGTGYSNCYQGLFGRTDTGANIHDVHLTDARIKGDDCIGGIVGSHLGGTVSGCTVTETAITATATDYYGYDYGYGTIIGYDYGYGTTLRNNYYRHCTVNGTAVTTGVGCYGADVTANDGAVPMPVLSDTGSNADAIATLATRGDQGLPTTYAVMLEGRTLYKDGDWNTLCLPFSMTAEQVSAQLAPDELMTLSTSSFAGGTLSLTFADATTIEAGRPYIIKWENTEGTEPTEDTELKNPVFWGVTVPSGYTSAEAITAALATASSSTDYVDFIGTFSPEGIYEEGTEKHNLYLGADNTLYYPTATDFKVKACRGWFQLKNGLTCGTPSGNGVRSFVLNFDGDATGVRLIDNGELIMDHEAGAWYDLSGRRVSVPSASSASSVLPKGVYIHNGRKVVVK